MKLNFSISPRSKATLEISAGLFLIFGYIWLVYPLYKKYWLHAIFTAMFIGLLILSRHIHKETNRQVGFRFDNFLSSGKILFPVTFAAILVLIIVKTLFYTIDFNFLRECIFWLRLIQYPFWALLQQYVILAFFFRRFRQTSSPHYFLAILASAITFSAMHIPNPPLMIFTFLGGLFWTWVYNKRPNLFAIAISHAVLGAVCCNLVSVYTVVGPYADIRWSKAHPIDYGICFINGTKFSHKTVLSISKESNSNINVEGWARAAKGQVEKVYVRFGRRYYPALYGTQNQKDSYKSPFGEIGFRAVIPISNLRPGYYSLSIKVRVKGRFFCHYPSSRMWIKIS